MSLAIKRFSHHERVDQTRRAFTTDTARARDMWLHAETTRQNSSMNGVIYDGQFRGVGAAMDVVRAALDSIPKGQRGKAHAMAVRDLSQYGNELGSGLRSGTMEVDPAGVLSTGMGDRPPEFDMGSGTSPRSINEANDRAWGRSGTRDSRGHDLSTRATPASIAAAGRKMWADLLGRPTSQDRVAVARDTVRCTNQTSPADINEMNRRFHSSTPEQPLNRPWGKG